MATCNNDTNVELCPEGFYCPTPTSIKPCQPGYYCGLGFTAPTPCEFGVTCPYHRMSSPSGAILFVISAILCLSSLFVYLQLANFSISRKEYKYKKYTIYDQTVIIEKEQEQTIDILGWANCWIKPFHWSCIDAPLFGSLISRQQQTRSDSSPGDEKQFSWGEGQPPSNTLRSEPTGQHALTEVAPHIVTLPRATEDSLGVDGFDGPLPLSLSSDLRSEPSEVSSSSTKSGASNYQNAASGLFAFNDIKCPLHVSFNELNLYLKKNNLAVLQNIFGVIKPFNITALMGPSGAGQYSR